MTRILIVGAFTMALFLGAAFKYERDHPCLEYGPEKVQYVQKIGNTLVPVYGKDCLRRASK